MKKPTNEMGVVSLFSQYAQGLGYIIMEIQAPFPDAVLYEISTGHLIRTEFEFKSKNFHIHGHDPSGCDLIICWEDNWVGCPLPVLSLDQLHKQEPVESVFDLSQKADGLEGRVKILSSQAGEAQRAFNEFSIGSDALKLAKKKIVELREKKQDVIKNKRIAARAENQSSFDSPVGLLTFDTYCTCRGCKAILGEVYADENRKTYFVSLDHTVISDKITVFCGCKRKKGFYSGQFAGGSLPPS